MHAHHGIINTNRSIQSKDAEKRNDEENGALKRKNERKEKPK